MGALNTEPPPAGSAPPTTPPPPSPLGDEPSVSPREFLIACVIMLAFTTIFVAARVAATLHRQRVGIADVISVLSVALLSTFVGLSYEMNQNMFPDPTTPLTDILLYTQVTNWIAALAMWCSKAPIIFLFISLFGIERWLRFVSYATLVVLAVAVISAAGVTSATCNPNGDDLSPLFLLECSDVASKVGVGLGVISVVVDVIIMVIPIPVVIKLNLPTHKKAGLFVMFTSGIFAVIASAISVYYKWESKDGSTANVTAAMVCTMVESCIATIVGCVPATYTIWSQVISTNPLYLRLVSTFSTTSWFSREKQSGQSDMSGKLSGDRQGRGASGGGSSSTEHINAGLSPVPRDARYKIIDEHSVTSIPLNALQRNTANRYEPGAV